MGGTSIPSRVLSDPLAACGGDRGGGAHPDQLDVSADGADASSPTRLVLVPSFIKTGLVALVCLETLEVRTVGFEAPSWDGDVNGRDDVEMADASGE